MFGIDRVRIKVSSLSDSFFRINGTFLYMTPLESFRSIDVTVESNPGILISNDGFDPEYATPAVPM